MATILYIALDTGIFHSRSLPDGSKGLRLAQFDRMLPRDVVGSLDFMFQTTILILGIAVSLVVHTPSMTQSIRVGVTVVLT
jgi:hypothetical protein